MKPGPRVLCETSLTLERPSPIGMYRYHIFLKKTHLL